MFFTGSLEKYVPIFDKAASLLTEELPWAASGQSFVDVHSPDQDLGLNVICSAAFGLLRNQEPRFARPVIQMICKVGDCRNRRSFTYV